MFRFSFSDMSLFDHGDVTNFWRESTADSKMHYSLRSYHTRVHHYSLGKKEDPIMDLETSAMECQYNYVFFYTGESEDYIVQEGSEGDDYDESSWEMIMDEAKDCNHYGLDTCNKYVIKTNCISFNSIKYCMEFMQANVVAARVETRDDDDFNNSTFYNFESGDYNE